MNKTLKELAELVGGKLKGDENILIIGVGDLETAGEGQISFIKDRSYVGRAKESLASAFVAPIGTELPGRSVIEVSEAYLAFTKILKIVSEEKRSFYRGIHQTAIIGKNSKLCPEVSVGPYAVIGEDVSIGENTVICSNTFIGDRTVIGKETFIYPNVSIREDTVIGERVIVHCGTVIGSDGFGYIPKGEEYVKIPQVGRVVIEDDVEIGSNVSIDRATLDKTLIGRGTKIDNLVHIAHNVKVGENSLLLAQVTIAGGTRLGKHVIFSGQAGAIDNLNIGDNVIAAARSGILNDVPSNTVVWGMPAIPSSEEKKIVASLKNLPQMVKEFRKLKEKIEKLEEDKNQK
ncbi:MAG: UDP-3-O-(3-hydroxymyristoyl)glucosamine N-acyltransferase [Elusimicrobia bacterium CG1_02_37_114]|nr:MAG: UDP-3-O-(3-hydroxymyristoyl)glucosamine N-acyltransferase [Elusimicrobia bacterium CG1_02_37_114]